MFLCGEVEFNFEIFFLCILVRSLLNLYIFVDEVGLSMRWVCFFV